MKTFLQQAAPEQREALAQTVDSSVAYFYQIAGGHKKPSPKLARALNKAEPQLTLHELRPDVWEPTTSRKYGRRSTDKKP